MNNNNKDKGKKTLSLSLTFLSLYVRHTCSASLGLLGFLVYCPIFLSSIIRYWAIFSLAKWIINWFGQGYVEHPVWNRFEICKYKAYWPLPKGIRLLRQKLRPIYLPIFLYFFLFFSLSLSLISIHFFISFAFYLSISTYLSIHLSVYLF